MSVQRIESKRHKGWQARAYLRGQSGKRLTQYVSDASVGGRLAAFRLAKRIEASLKAQASDLHHNKSKDL